jgi:hypothetical protein
VHREGAYLGRHPFFRSYGIIMPSSLTTFHSFTLGYSPRPPVSVYGTDVVCTNQSSFSCVFPLPLAIRSRPEPTPLDGHPQNRIRFVPLSLSGSNAHTAGWESSPTVHRLRLWGLALGSASPCADCHGAGILGLSVSEVFTLICAYSFRHPHFSSLHDSFPRSLHR